VSLTVLYQNERNAVRRIKIIKILRSGNLKSSNEDNKWFWY